MNKYKYILKVLFIFFIFISLFIFNIYFTHEVFAMEPSGSSLTNYYEGKENTGPNVYAYFHPDPAPDIDTIQSKVSNYGTPINDD
jgi:hypothetical protein